MLSTLTDQVLGEIPAMALIDGFDVLDAPRDGVSVSLEKLPQKLADMGMRTDWDAAAYLENHYTAYELEPNQDVDADWRMDVFAGSTCCPALVNGYLSNQSETMDAFHQNGAVPGFFCYPVDGFTGAEQGQSSARFPRCPGRSGAEGGRRRCCYLCGWCVGSALWLSGLYRLGFAGCAERRGGIFGNEPRSLGEFSHVPPGCGVPCGLINRENDAPVVDEQTGSLLSQEDIAALAAFEEGGSRILRLRMWSYLVTILSVLAWQKGALRSSRPGRTFRLPCGTLME